MAGRHDDDKLDKHLRFEREFKGTFSNLYGGVRAVARGSVHAVYLRLKSDGRWLALAKRHNPEAGRDEVAFGEGSSFVEALRELNGSLSAGRWKEDRPWRAGS